MALAMLLSVVVLLCYIYKVATVCCMAGCTCCDAHISALILQASDTSSLLLDVGSNETRSGVHSSSLYGLHAA